MLVSNSKECRTDSKIPLRGRLYRGWGWRASGGVSSRRRVGTLEGKPKSGQMLTSNIGLFGWILKIRRLPVLGLEFEAESQKWVHIFMPVYFFPVQNYI